MQTPPLQAAFDIATQFCEKDPRSDEVRRALDAVANADQLPDRQALDQMVQLIRKEVMGNREPIFFHAVEVIFTSHLSAERRFKLLESGEIAHPIFYLHIVARLLEKKYLQLECKHLLSQCPPSSILRRSPIPLFQAVEGNVRFLRLSQVESLTYGLITTWVQKINHYVKCQFSSQAEEFTTKVKDLKKMKVDRDVRALVALSLSRSLAKNVLENLRAFDLLQSHLLEIVVDLFHRYPKSIPSIAQKVPDLTPKSDVLLALMKCWEKHQPIDCYLNLTTLGINREAELWFRGKIPERLLDRSPRLYICAARDFQLPPLKRHHFLIEALMKLSEEEKTEIENAIVNEVETIAVSDPNLFLNNLILYKNIDKHYFRICYAAAENNPGLILANLPLFPFSEKDNQELRFQIALRLAQNDDELFDDLWEDFGLNEDNQIRVRKAKERCVS